MNITNNVNSMLSHQELLNNSAHNIANSNTEGFNQIETQIVSNENTITTQTSIGEGYSLTNNILSVNLAKQVFEMNAKIIETTQDIEKTILNIKK